jgi:hypothetical protein
MLIEVFAATTTTTGGDNGFDPWKTLAIPGAVAAVVGLMTSYLVGIIRPLAVKKPRYWHAGDQTRFSCIVRNRSFVNERSVSGLSLVVAPGWFKRTFWPFWKRKPQRADLLLWDVPDSLKLSKRNEEPIEGEIRKGRTNGIFDPGPRFRLLAHAGSRSSRSRRLKKDAAIAQ